MCDGRKSFKLFLSARLDTTPPTVRARTELREELLGRLPGPQDHLTPGMAALLIPRLWKARILHSPESTAGLVKHIVKWSFSLGSEWSWRTEITIELADAALEARWGVHRVEPNEVARLHDAMTVQWLYKQIGLTDLFGPVPKNPYLLRSNLGRDLQDLPRWDHEAVQQFLRERQASPDPNEWPKALCNLFDIADRSVFAVRIFDEPDLLRMLVGDDFPYNGGEILKKAEEIRSTLGDDPRERLRAAG